MASTKTEKVYYNLQSDIIKGIVQPGSRLIISHVAKRFDVSEIPVREAMQRLVQEGYITIQPHAGAIVNSLSEDDMRQIFEVRFSLESLAARLTVDQISNTQIKLVKELLEESREALNNQDLEKYTLLNRRFHNAIYQHCNNDRLIGMINDLWDLSARYPKFFNDNMELGNVSFRHHEEIYNALEQRNAELIELLVNDHLEWAYPIFIDLIRKNSNQ